MSTETGLVKDVEAALTDAVERGIVILDGQCTPGTEEMLAFY